MNCLNSTVAESPYKLLLEAAFSIPNSHYLLGLTLCLIVFLYSFLEIHFFEDLLNGFKGQKVTLTFNPYSQLYHDVVSKCKILHGRYLSTPWLCSPHLQTMFVHFIGNAPVVNYRRELFTTSDGGTLALDWVVINPGDKKPFVQPIDAVQPDDKNPIVIIVPGLTSDGGAPYIKHCAFKMVKPGWKVVVSNHRGLGGVPLTSDLFYHGGWTDDLRAVVKHLHSQYPEAPLFLVGTSLGANMLVLYLGEDGNDVPIAGAAAICCPWDPLLCDRYLKRGIKQRLYSKALAHGLKGYASLHKAVVSRIAKWEKVEKSCCFRDFDDATFRVVANCKTVDTYYRHCCCVKVVKNIKVPLLCIGTVDDPVCTSEAIPWDECRLNKNVVLATTQHGGHMPYYEGLSAKSVWWVRAVDEFLSVLHSNLLTNQQKKVHG